MNKDQIKKALSTLGIAALVTGLTISAPGCKSADKTEQAGGETQVEAAADTSQGAATADTAKGSCGQGEADKDTSGSCGQGSCGS